MNKKVNRVGLKLRQFITTVALLGSPVLASAATCVVGGTNFDTKADLCDPSYVNDTTEKGWFYKDLGKNLNKACGTTMSSDITQVDKLGLQTATLAAGGKGDFSAYEKVTGKDVQGTGNPGYSKIVANPRVVNPFFMETTSGNMMIQGGASQDQSIFTYSVSGLKPNSQVTFSFDAYNLVSLENIEDYLVLINKGVTTDAKLQRSVTIFGSKFEMSSQNGKLTPGSVKNYDQLPSIAVVAGPWSANAGQGIGAKKLTFNGWGEKGSLSMTATADKNGNITFNLGRLQSGNVPLGIDNVKIVGEIAPTITGADREVCPKNPVILSLGQAFPEGTTYKWSGLGTESKSATALVEPEEIKKSYDMSCVVTMKTSDGTCEATAKTTIKTKECCTMKNENNEDIPVAETSIFFEDFGRFQDDKYYYKDRVGIEHSRPIDGYTWGKDGVNHPAWEPVSLFLQPGVKTPDLKPAAGGNMTPEKAWIITPTLDYATTFPDHTGNPGGGMFFFDLQEDSKKGDVIYERTVTDLCPSKKITFRAWFSSGNANPAAGGTGELAIQLVKPDGTVLYRKESGMLNNPEWILADYDFIPDETIGKTLTLQVINLTDRCEGPGKADFAIDDISFTVCSPPNVAVESSLTAAELLDLCKDKPLTLNAQISETAKSYYNNKEGYLFQYTYDDPATTDDDKIKWEDLSDIQGDGSFTILSPADDKAFLPLKNAKKGELNVYFRVVIGQRSFLENHRDEWEKQSALSPCRAISISSIPIVAALNCEKCYDPTTVKINHDSPVIGNLATKELTLCPGDKLNLSSLVTGQNDDGETYNGYYLYWKKDGNNVAGYTKLANFTKNAANEASANPARELEVENDGSYTVTTDVEYTLIAVDTFQFTSVKDASCKDSVKIKVKMLPKPKATAAEAALCFGDVAIKLGTEPSSTEGTVNFYTGKDATGALIGKSTTVSYSTLPEGKNDLYWTVTTVDGCISDTADYTVTVGAIPDLVVNPIPDFCAGKSEVTALVTDTTDAGVRYSIAWTPSDKAVSLNSLTGQDTPYDLTYDVSSEYMVGTQKLVCTSENNNYSYTIKPAVTISLDTDQSCGTTKVLATVNPTTADLVSYFAEGKTEADKETANFGAGTAFKNTYGYPTDKDGLLKVVADQAGYCKDSAFIDVVINPVPADAAPRPVTCYLKSQAASFMDVQQMCLPDVKAMADPEAGYEIVWRPNATAAWSTTAPTPTVQDANSSATETTPYQAAYRHIASGCVGKVGDFDIKVFGAPAPEPLSPEYCLDDPSVQSFKDIVRQSSHSLPGVAYKLYVYTDKLETATVGIDGLVENAGSPSVATPGKKTYYARQWSQDGGYSDYVDFTVTTYGVLPPNRVQTTDSFYCVGATPAALTDYVSANALDYNKFGSFMWSEDGGTTYSATVPTISTLATSETVYNVKQIYEIKDGTNLIATCEGDPVKITINVQETAQPQIANVSYLFTEMEANGGRFLNLADQMTARGGSLIADADAADYTYEYAECDPATCQPIVSTWSTTVPTPAPVTKAELGGATKTICYAARRISNTGAKCPSNYINFNVSISDSPVPLTPTVYFCEGASIPSLETLVDLGAGPSTYKLLWYGTTMPTDLEADVLPGGAPSAPSASIDVPTQPKAYTYYVAQQDDITKAIGSVAELKIIVYPKPVLTLTKPTPVCTPATVDLSKTVSYTEAAGVTGYATKYFSDAAGATEISNTVAQRGLYYAQTSFVVNNPNRATITDAVCASSIENVQVDIDELSLTVRDEQTCPNTSGTLTANIVTNITDQVTYTWSGQAAGTGSNIDTKTAPDNVNTSVFNTAVLPGDADDQYNFDLVVSAGACTAEQRFIKMTLGDGPIEGGSLKLAQDAKENTTNGTVAYVDRDNTSDPYYACFFQGNTGVIGTVDFTKTEGDYTWTSDNGFSEVDNGSGVLITKPGTYTVSYINKCATSVTFKVIDAAVETVKFKMSGDGDYANHGETLAVCENSDVDVILDYYVHDASANSSAIEWTTPSVTGLKETGGKLMAVSPDMHTGNYFYKVTNHGCFDTASINLKVKPRIKFTADKYSYIARRDSALDIVTELKVPANGTLPATAQYEWRDQNGYTNFTGTTTLNYPVVEDKTFTLTVSDDENYCEASTQVVVQMDGRLQLETELEESMCRGDNGVYLVVDTTQTGKLVKKGEYRLEIIETVGEIAHQLNAQMIMDDGKMKYEIHPTENASYKVTAYYRYDDQTASEVDKQMVTSSEEITVLQPIRIEVPKNLRVCAGDELDINLVSVTPEGAVTVNWIADNSITSGTTDTESITVAPEYDEEQGHNHKYTKYYNLVATMEGCKDKEAKVAVVVDEPITGVIADTTICEGFSVRLDVSNFQASTYSWTTKTVGNPLGSSSTLRVTPEVTTEYLVDMIRGECTAQEKITVNVHATPTIVDIDSLGYRSIQILYDESGDAAPYYFSVDNKEFVASSIFDSLSYNNHVAYIKDRYDCKDTLAFNIKAPQVKIPIWFSPNGDGDFDKWECEGLSVTYPEAEIKIFDRWGKELAKFTGADGGWDGTYKGQDMPSTDYWYEIHVREIDKIYTGHFTLMRR